ncbi:MAG: hypothetical protein COT38_00950 [Candidatus Omnitrophica bacterium CG08_land_8_20_14_0_20_41_16]|uniref:Uncharacterized protein n=1 Tax=Candidatus Sherwoodlollariibacterium unditelluris TaxID=1974757 RepID=A0A2G9YIC1_9BACT|nr:MAG: hypothetical protein COX41_05185 [Candidatus Omnitrophica bacterium CG23_combo_of_CG06-09_8_20_14_all_41_10]PIS34263.1 MAG: hypothetical protein COT38_00950 [Candidatus Omnitrophica bacterium CG08_land_8_20_14_0_20_41_16]
MKTKTLYAIVFILAIIIILTFIYSKGKVSELNQPMPKAIQIEARQPEVTTQSTEPVFFHKQAITVIKPAQKKQQVVSEADKTQGLKYPQDLNSSSVQSSSLSSGGANSQDAGEAAAAGITRPGKYPTKEEVKEMNSKGIVMY